ncbi:MAG: LytR family transcriptional regulator, partial [Synergistaceae bacterium]|nr:LytR family transcriptional regulator [Synergistaceae bacterium]
MNWKKNILILILASFSFGAGAYYRFNHIDIDDIDGGRHKNERVQDVDSEPAEEREKLDIAGRINILLIGEDNVEGSKRSDTVAFVAIDVDENNMRVLSLPRDTRVRIPGHG